MYHSGARKLSSFGALSSVGLTPGYDVEDLVLVGRRVKCFTVVMRVNVNIRLIILGFYVLTLAQSMSILCHPLFNAECRHNILPLQLPSRSGY